MRNMPMRRLLFIVAVAFAGTAAMAQSEYTPEYLSKTENYRERLGHGRDSVEAERFYVEYVTAFRKAYDSKVAEDWLACYRPWKESMALAPFSTYNLTNSGGGEAMLIQLIENEKDTIQRYVYFRDLMNTDAFRIQHREQLNAIPKDGGEKRIPLTAGSVQLWRAHHYHTVGMRNIPDRVYRKDSAYQYFVDAFAQIRKESVGADNEIEPNYLMEYFETCRDLYLSDKDKYMEQFLTDYTTCLETCDKMMSVYGNGVDSVKWGYYAGVRNNTQVYFNQVGAGSASNLEAFYTPRIDSMKTNYPALKNAIHLMMTNDTLLAKDVYYKACQHSYKLHPDFENCIGMAQFEKNVMEDRDNALKYFNEASQLASTPAEKFITNAQVALALMAERTPSAKTLGGEWETLSTTDRNNLLYAWRSRQTVAARMLDEAIGYGLEAGINGQNLAPYYLYMAIAYRRAENASTINLATQALDQIHLVYPLFPQNRIDDERQNIANVKSNLEKKAAQEAEYRKNKADYETQLKRRAEYERKMKAEEDFWKKK